MAATFPISPVNGELAIVNNITYVYASATRSWTRVASNVAVGGSNTQIQYNNANAFGGSPAFTFNSSTNVIAATGNISSGNLLTSGLLSTTGNIYAGTANAGYVYGNAYFMTGISAAISVTKIENGNSNVWVNSPGGDVTVTAGGVSNVAVFSTGSLTLQGAFGTPKTITANVEIAGNINAMLIGPLVFGNGIHLLVPDSSTVYIYSPNG